MRKIMAPMAGLLLASFANASVVTYTLALHESSTGAITATNQFALYATVSQGDNSGLFAYSVDLKGTGDVGGPTTLTLVNRTPNGTWDADQADPNFDPGADYQTKFGGFGALRSASTASGVVRGMMDFSRGNNLIRVYGVGQQAHRMDDFRPPPDMSTGVPVAYGPYIAATSTDGGATPYGNPSNPAGGSSVIPPGSVRIMTGSWTGIAPSLQQLSENTAACVWKLNTTSDEVEAATLQFAVRDVAGVGEPSAFSMESSALNSSAVCTVPEPSMIFGALSRAILAGGRRRRGASITKGGESCEKLWRSWRR